MEVTSTFGFPSAETAFSTVSECIEELTIMLQGILKLNYSLVQGQSRDKVQEEVLSNKSNVLRRIQRLFKETEEADDEGSSSCFFPTPETATTTISECIDNLLTMENSIYEIQRPGFKFEASYRGQDVYFFKYKVVRSIRMLFKETKETESHSESMDVEESDDESTEESGDESSSFYFPDQRTAFYTITKCIRELVILRRKVSLQQVKEQNNTIHALMYRAMCQIQMLFNKDHLYHRPKRHSSKKAVAAVNISECIDELRRMLVLVESNVSFFQGKSVESLDMKQQKVLDIKSKVVRRIEEMLFKVTLEEDKDMDEAVPAAARESSPLLPFSVSELVDAIISARWLKTEEFSWSSDDRKKETKGRYLCVSNGFEIWCLDLKHYSQTDKSRGPVALPKIASLNLLERKLPASVGLFNLGTEAYIIGGQMLSGLVEVDEHIETHCTQLWGENPQGIQLYKSRCFIQGIKGSSRVTYRLSLDVDKDCTLSHYEADDIIKELKTPKVWPIVENIDGQLHVMDSIPARLVDKQRIWTFSHEARHIGEKSNWKEIPTCMKEEKKERLMSHVVVGNRIYALTNKRHFVFDSQMEKWEGYKRKIYLNAFNVEQVSDILNLGIARCVGKIPRPHGECLFLLVALVRHCHSTLITVTRTMAVAYVVTLTGRVVCYQPLPDFFEEGPFQPCDMIAGTMIKVDPDEEGTVCTVVSATILPDSGRREYMFINTLSVEVPDDAVDKVEELLKKKASDRVVQAEFKFVRIVSNDRSVYHTDAELKTVGATDDGWIVDWRTCFVNPS